MTEKRILILAHAEARKNAHKAIDEAVDGSKVTIGPPGRSLDQNALFHVWLTLYAGHILKKDRKLVSKAELEGMKRIVKKKFYQQFGYPWMLIKPINPFTLEEGKTDYASSSDYKTGEMFQLLTWLQMQAANDGLVLESTGEFSKLQKKNEGIHAQ